jgi:hypothetical protein
MFPSADTHWKKTEAKLHRYLALVTLRRNEEVILDLHRLICGCRRQSRPLALHDELVDCQLQLHHRHVDAKAGRGGLSAYSRAREFSEADGVLTSRASSKRSESVDHVSRGIEPAVRVEPGQCQFSPLRHNYTALLAGENSPFRMIEDLRVSMQRISLGAHNDSTRKLESS